MPLQFASKTKSYFVDEMLKNARCSMEVYRNINVLSRVKLTNRFSTMKDIV